MGRSRRKYKKYRTKVRVGLPPKKPGVFKPAVAIPEKLAAAAAAIGEGGGGWDNKGSVIRNYRAFGVIANPNLLGVRARTPQIVQSTDLQIPDRELAPVSEFNSSDSGSDLETDDVKIALGKKRKNVGANLLPLTAMQRIHVGKLIEKYGDDYEAMFKDIKLNSMQHSVATLKKLCQRYNLHGKHYIT